MSNTDKTIESIRALLDLDARGALVPHGVGGLARDVLSKCAELLGQPADQPQGEPVAIVDEGDDGLFIDFIYGEDGSSLRRGDKLYTHADPGEIERLHDQYEKLWSDFVKVDNENDTLRAQLEEANDRAFRASEAHVMTMQKLTERGALLRESYAELLAIKAEIGFRGATIALIGRIDAALSASAEPSAPKCGHPACASLGEPHPFCDFVRNLEPSAPVERDERASFEGVIGRDLMANRFGERFRRTSEGTYVDGSVRDMWVAWQARAALERKP